MAKNEIGARSDRMVVLDCGGQYAHLIAGRVRKEKVFSVILPHHVSVDRIMEHEPAGIILSGGPRSVYEENAPSVDPKIFSLGIPVMGICYGHQLMAHLLGGEVASGEKSEYGAHLVEITKAAWETPFNYPILDKPFSAWMSHADQVVAVPPGFEVFASTENCPVAAMADRERRLYSTQFHPEVEHTEDDGSIIRSFVRNMCAAEGNWVMADFKESAIRRVREEVGDSYVIGALSGGVDSFTLSKLLQEAIGDRYFAVFVDNGLLRKNEAEQVIAALNEQGVRHIFVDASERFLTALAGFADPEAKRKIVGRLFIEVFKEEAKKLEQSGLGKKIEYLAQGTIYPDVVESVSAFGAPSVSIKSHHNVGGLPAEMGLKLIEPFRLLFKDEVRQIARELGLPQSVWGRHPSPGPGSAIRQLGAVKPEFLAILREADAIFIEELHKAGLYYSIGQAFAVFPCIESVGVMGDGRTYQHCIALRSVDTSVYMTAKFTRLPWELLERVSTRITNEVKGVNRVVYDITSKPPGTIEWE